MLTIVVNIKDKFVRLYSELCIKYFNTIQICIYARQINPIDS